MEPLKIDSSGTDRHPVWSGSGAHTGSLDETTTMVTWAVRIPLRGNFDLKFIDANLIKIRPTTRRQRKAH